MQYYISFFAFVFGAMLGSFFLVLADRFPKQGLRGVTIGRSNCENCKRSLGFLDLVPLISFIALQGKCRYCKTALSWRYFFVELIFGFLAFLIYRQYGINPSSLLNLLIIYLLIVVGLIDWDTQLISEQMLLVVVAFIIIQKFLTGFDINSIILGLIIGGGIFAAIVIISKERWMGVGDIELGALLGLWLGYPLIIPTLYLAIIIGAIYGLLLITAKKATGKTAISFAPFLITGAIITLFFGQFVIQWYLESFMV